MSGTACRRKRTTHGCLGRALEISSSHLEDRFAGGSGINRGLRGVNPKKESVHKICLVFRLSPVCGELRRRI